MYLCLLTFWLIIHLEHPVLQPPDRVALWKEDLAAFASQFKSKHIKPFAKMPEAEFDRAIQEIEPNKLNDQQIIMKLWQVMSQVGDSHSRVNPPRTIPFTQYPIAFIYLTDGWYVFAADQDYVHILMGKLIRIGNTTIDDACKKLSTLIASENPSQTENQLKRLLQMTEPLQFVGLTEKPEEASFTIQTATGKEENIVLTPISRKPAKWVYAIKPQTWPDHLKDRRPQHGFTWLDKNLYIWYDRCAEFPNYPIKKWTQDILNQINERKPGRIIIDLRRNGGGSSSLLEPLINSLGKLPINTKDSLFVLIGPATFSSALMNAQRFHTRTKASLVGQPTGGSPNHFGEVKFFTLPHSKCIVQYSTKYFKMTQDNVQTLNPDRLITPTAKGFFEDRDEVLEAVLKQ